MTDFSQPSNETLPPGGEPLGPPQSELRITLLPRSPLRLGEQGDMAENGARLRADTLWSALVSIAFERGQAALVERLRTEPNALWLASSTSVWKDCWFLPRPYFKPPGDAGDSSQRKQWKEVAFVSEKIFARMSQGHAVDIRECERLGDSCLLEKSEARAAAAAAALPEWLYGIDTAPANTLDRLTNAADPFERAELRFNVGAGARLGLHARVAADVREAFLDLLAELGKRGAGGERSIGKGAFDVESVAEVSAPLPSNPTGRRFVTLAPWLPTEEEVKAGTLHQAAYDLITRGGWIATRGMQRLRVRMLAEGAVACAPALPLPLGKIADVTPPGSPHPVWRYGRAYPLFLETS
ncbi:MAG: hypothetical protein NTX50_28710 [Candidatus Sumerlaeota bacterium]|nr:hypothetical protein [Candidatus Sumerlaeota bacterium]